MMQCGLLMCGVTLNSLWSQVHLQGFGLTFLGMMKDFCSHSDFCFVMCDADITENIFCTADILHQIFLGNEFEAEFFFNVEFLIMINVYAELVLQLDRNDLF